jgi:FKBP-type peptidyl-prolyl cis-trans isomerase
MDGTKEWRRQLIIPPELGYGAQGASGVVPGNATLKFEVKLLAVQAAQ